MRSINARGLELIKSFEGIPDGDPSTVNLDAYLDPVGIWTIGWGHAIRDTSGRYVKGVMGKTLARALYPEGLTLQQAEDLLKADLLDVARDVAAVISVPLNDNQFSALISFEFNTGALGSSTLAKKLNARDYTGAAAQFARWVKGHDSTGQVIVLPGLVRRRVAEQALFEATP